MKIASRLPLLLTRTGIGLLLAPAAGLAWAADAGTAAANVTARHARSLSATCTGCHGGAVENSPMVALEGLPAAQIEARMAVYRNNSGAPTVMHQIARGYTEAQVRLIAEYLSALPAAPGAAAARISR